MTTFYPSLLGEQISVSSCGCKIASVMIYQSSSTYNRTKQLIPVKLDQFNISAEGDNIRIGDHLLFKKTVIAYRPDLKDIIEVTRSFDLTDIKYEDSFVKQNTMIESGLAIIAKNGQLYFRGVTIPDDQCLLFKLLKKMQLSGSDNQYCGQLDTYQISLVSVDDNSQTIQLDLVTYDINNAFLRWDVVNQQTHMSLPITCGNQFTLLNNVPYRIGYYEGIPTDFEKQIYYVFVINTTPITPLPSVIVPCDPDVYIYLSGPPPMPTPPCGPITN